MCRSKEHGGRRCPGGHSSTRQAQAARQRLSRARKALSAAQAAGDPAAIRSVLDRLDDATRSQLAAALPAREAGDVTPTPPTSPPTRKSEMAATTTIPTQTAESAAADLGVSVSTVQRWLRTGEIRKHGVTGHKDSSGRWVITLLDDAPATSHPGDTADKRIEAQIRAAYDRLARRPGAWVGLADVRALVDAPRDQVDAVLRRLERRPDVNMVPESNQKTLRPEDRAAAIHIGAQDKHLLWFDPQLFSAQGGTPSGD
ncbi:helix-turn-helix domain-containing protein [Nonomuraea sp. NPDC048882]|uniref:helix-turn-helix domain-containing protein n=1 Tax=Nonomuraea sp. NPDC048882 TaxID=3154347 RepID=UPI0033CA70D6